MGLLKKLKSTLGLASTSDRQETTVTVEYEPDAESESAVKGTDEPAAAGTDAAGSTDSITEEPPEPPEDEAESEAEAGAVEPGEAAGPTTAAAEPESVDGSAGSDAGSEGGSGVGAGAGAGTGDATESVESTETGDDDVDGDADAAAEADTDTDESLQTIDGIGSAYAERLRAAGIETVGDLRGGDATALAEETGLSEKRIERWIDRAGE